jgi:hypothetical protein
MAIIRNTVTGLMPVIKPYIPQPRTVLVVIIAFLVGMVWAYVIDPTVFYNAQPSQLEQSWQNTWVELLADRRAAGSYSDESITDLLRAVDNPTGIVDAQSASTSGETPQRLADIRPLAEQAEPGTLAPQPSLIASIRPWLLGSVVIAVVAVIASLLYGFYIQPIVVEPIKRRLAPKTESDARTQAEIAAIKDARKMREAMEADIPVSSLDAGPPVSRHISLYTPGRAYDDSFSIEDANEAFLGECGVAISETIGVGSPEKVTAIEVWLFDKEDFVRTITKVFVSEHAYNDPAIRSKLEPKGELVVVKPGAIAVLETNTLRLQARIVDVAYGTGPLPPNSYFEKLTIELATWKKDGLPVGAPVPAAPVAVPAPSFSSLPPSPAPSPASAAPPASSPFGSGSAPMSSPPPPSPFGGGGPSPLRPPPMQSPPPAPPRPPAPPPDDDDPFGGTGDFTPVS